MTVDHRKPGYMSAVLTGHDAAVAEWVGGKVGKPFSDEMKYTAIGVVSPEGRLIGGYVFTGHTGTSIEMSLAGSGVALRSTWAAVIDYVFRQLGCVRLQVHTRRDNARARKQATRLGFRYEGTMRRYYGDCAGLVYSLTVDDLPAFRERWKIHA